MSARESLASVDSRIEAAHAAPSALIIRLEQLSTELCDRAFTWDLRGNPVAAELAVEIARRLREAIDEEETGIEPAAGLDRSDVIISFALRHP